MGFHINVTGISVVFLSIRMLLILLTFLGCMLCEALSYLSVSIILFLLLNVALCIHVFIPHKE